MICVSNFWYERMQKWKQQTCFWVVNKVVWCLKFSMRYIGLVGVWCVCLSVFVCCGVYSYILILNVGAGRRTGFMLIFSIVVFVFFDELASSSNCLEFVVMHLSSFLEFHSFLCGRKEETKILGIDRELHLWWTYVSVPRFRVRHPHLPTPWMFL